MERTPAKNARDGHVKDFAVSKELRLLVPKAFSQLTCPLHATWMLDVFIPRSSRDVCRF